MRSLLLLLLAVVAVSATATGLATAQGPVQDTPDPRITDGSAQRALDAARSTWRAQKVADYRIRVALSCFCPEDIRRPVTLTIRGGKPLKAPEHLRDVASVTRLFRTVQAAIDDKVAMLDVRYDTRRGFPRQVSIDRSRMIADEESYYAADRFVPRRRK